MSLFDVKWRRPNDPEVLECHGLTAEQLVFRIRGVIRMCGSVELLSVKHSVPDGRPIAKEENSKMAKFRKKPVVIEAFRWMRDEVPDWWRAPGLDVQVHTASGVAVIPTLEGKMYAQPGDWIIKGVKGEIYPCKDDIFRATYEPAEDEEITRRNEEWVRANVPE